MRETVKALVAVLGFAVFLVGLMAGLAYLVVPLVLPAADARQLNTLLAAVALPSLVLGGAMAREAVNALNGRPSGRPHFPPVSVLLLMFVGVLLLGPGALRDGRPGAYIFPLLFVLGISLPLLIILRVVVQRSRAVLSRELTLQLGYGSFVAPALAFAVEAIVFIGLFAVGLGIVAVLPQGRAWLDQIQSLAANPAALQDEVTMGRLILSPPVLALVLIVGVVVGPLVEEAVKVLGVAAMGYRHPVRGQALAWGIAAGAGFALTEGLLGAVMLADQWPMSIGLRMAASVLHVTTTGIVALGWFESVAARRNVWSLPLAYLAAVALHGLWNGLALAATAVSAGVSAGAVPATTAAPISAGVAALLALTFLAMLTLLGGLIAWTGADEVTAMPSSEQTTA